MDKKEQEQKKGGNDCGIIFISNHENVPTSIP